MVNGEKTCEKFQHDNLEYNSDCRRLELSGEQGRISRERIETAIQLRSDKESRLLEQLEIDRLKNKNKKVNNSCGVGIHPRKRSHENKSSAQNKSIQKDNLKPNELEMQATDTHLSKKEKTEDCLKIESDDECIIVENEAKMIEPVTVIKHELTDPPTPTQSFLHSNRQPIPDLSTPPLIESPLLNHADAQSRNRMNMQDQKHSNSQLSTSLSLNQHNLTIRNNLNFDINPSSNNYENLNPYQNPYSNQMTQLPAANHQINQSSIEQLEAENIFVNKENIKLKITITQLQQELEHWKTNYFNEKNRKIQ